ncbi:phage head spike fiber domain-containing protein [Chelatococcus asaccharovorans]|uniref:phage head spike fiber domain-containing protein n=1 Tax=Chelatococcus asaccharovorans TaxID=28210 RepID=UPI00224C75E8|nr:hypothetical protein [Chelatococcus asaccharovorans]CAH1671217.1 conserved hypothetical protein [Chelatococcus asaccharovorans]CAH1677338.1 conserved hypothetical protein [Chelatococcus asaccharovorans]
MSCDSEHMCDIDGPTVLVPDSDEPLVIEVDVPGAPGPSGPPNQLSIGAVSTGAVAVTITGAAPNQVLNLTLPDGGGPNTAAAAELGASLAAVRACGVTRRPCRVLDFANGVFFLRHSLSTASWAAIVAGLGATFSRATPAAFWGEGSDLQAAGIDAPRFEYRFNSGIADGLLLEGARTNAIRNSILTGVAPGVIGSGGAWPTNWQNGGASGLTRTMSAPYQYRGMTCIDVRYAGTATDTGGYPLIFEPPSVIAASSGQNWTMSAYLALVAGSMANITNFRFYIPPQPSGVAAASTSIVPELTSELKRFAFSFSFATAITHIQPRFAMNHAVGAAIDFTLRVGLPQMELGAFSSSPIATETGAVERGADHLQCPRPGLSPVSRMLTARAAGGKAGDQVLWQADDGSEANSHRLLRDATGMLRYIVTTTGTPQANLALGSVADGALFKVAVRAAPNDFAGSLNGGAVVTDTSGTLPSITTERWGGGAAPGVEWWGALASEVEFNATLANADLQALSL